MIKATAGEAEGSV